MRSRSKLVLVVSSKGPNNCIKIALRVLSLNMCKESKTILTKFMKNRHH